MLSIKPTVPVEVGHQDQYETRYFVTVQSSPALTGPQDAQAPKEGGQEEALARQGSDKHFSGNRVRSMLSEKALHHFEKSGHQLGLGPERS